MHPLTPYHPYRNAVQLPPNQDRKEWLAINSTPLYPFTPLTLHVSLAVDFFNQLNLIYGCISEFCTDTSCPIMSAGKKYEYLMWPTPTTPKPHAVSAPNYVTALLEWIEQQLDDERVFPREAAFPSDFENHTIKTIFKRMFRVYAHIYHGHLAQIEQMNEQKHLNTCFKHFWYFCKEFDLVDAQEQRPLAHIIEQLTK